MRDHRSPLSIRGNIGATARKRADSTRQRSPDDLARVLEVVIGWYEDPLGGGLPQRRSPLRCAMNSGEVVRHYLALRSEWEMREAFRLAEQMNGYQWQANRQNSLRDRLAR